MVEPRFSMFWANEVPIVNIEDKSGNKSEIRIVAGTLNHHKAPSPPPDSWASIPESDEAIWSMRLQPKSLLELPAVKAGTRRNLYVLSGAFKIGSQVVSAGHVASLATADAVVLENDSQLTDVLLLQGRPIAEPIARYGPFVMNTREEIQKPFLIIAGHNLVGGHGTPMTPSMVAKMLVLQSMQTVGLKSPYRLVVIS